MIIRFVKGYKALYMYKLKFLCVCNVICRKLLKLPYVLCSEHAREGQGWNGRLCVAEGAGHGR